MKKVFLILLPVLCSAFFIACEPKEDEAPYFAHVESVAFKPAELTLSVTKTFRLELVFTPENAGNKKVTWINSNPEVATVSSEGLVTAISVGTTTISVQTDDMRRKASIIVTVEPFRVDNPITSITLSETSHSFQVTDGSITLTKTILPADASMPTVVWSTTDPYVASVDENGVVKPVGHGKAKIKAMSIDGSGQFAECEVSVNGIKDKNYDLTDGINADGYYKIIYYPVEVEITLADGTKKTQLWLDRNLGAKKVAASFDDYEAYGSLFQWSRKADGHEQINWTTAKAGVSVYPATAANERVTSRENAGHTKFIPVASGMYDWVTDKSSELDGLWGGKSTKLDISAPLDSVTQVNNPCPIGYRVPTVDEFMQMATAVTGEPMKFNTQISKIKNPNQVFADHVIHLPSAGLRNYKDAAIMNISERGAYWTNASAAPAGENYNNSNRFLFFASYLMANPYQRSNGYSIRCIRDDKPAK